MDTRKNGRSQITILALLILIVLSNCGRNSKKDSQSILIDRLKQNNFRLYMSNRSLSCSRDTLVGMKKTCELNDNVHRFFEESRSHFIFKVKNGDKIFFVADTLNYNSLKDFDDYDAISEYLRINKKRIVEEIRTINIAIRNNFKDSGFKIPEPNIELMINGRSSALEVLQLFLMIENDCMIYINSKSQS